MRDYKAETEARVAFIRKQLEAAGATGIIELPLNKVIF